MIRMKQRSAHTHTHTHKPTTNQKPATKYMQKISLKSKEKVIKNKSQV